eukprot:6455816-Lingulodinium_polyedra.AAC.1
MDSILEQSLFPRADERRQVLRRKSPPVFQRCVSTHWHGCTGTATIARLHWSHRVALEAWQHVHTHHRTSTRART